MELVATVSPAANELRVFENGEVLRDRLPAESDVMFGRETAANLEQGLVVPSDQDVQDRPAGRCVERIEDIGHDCTP